MSTETVELPEPNEPAVDDAPAENLDTAPTEGVDLAAGYDENESDDEGESDADTLDATASTED